MRILVMNVNTTASMTAVMRTAARAAAGSGTEVVADQPTWGPVSIEGYYESFVSAAAILDRLHQLGAPDAFPFDALVWAGFGEHGKEGARELLDVPVIDITSAAAHVACLLGHKYGVVTTLRRACPQIEDSLRLEGLLQRCAAIRATGLEVLEVEQDWEATKAVFVREARIAVDQGAEVIVLGCGGMAGLEQAITGALGCPVVDGIAAAVKLAEACHALGLQTSKLNAFGHPLPKARPGWPVTRDD